MKDYIRTRPAIQMISIEETVRLQKKQQEEETRLLAKESQSTTVQTPSNNLGGHPKQPEAATEKSVRFSLECFSIEDDSAQEGSHVGVGIVRPMEESSDSEDDDTDEALDGDGIECFWRKPTDFEPPPLSLFAGVWDALSTWVTPRSRQFLHQEDASHKPLFQASSPAEVCSIRKERKLS